jgi:hypothetical protein
MVMKKSLTVSELFRAVRLKPSVAVKWDDIPSIKKESCGVYIVAITKNPNAACGKSDISRLRKAERERWLQFQPVIYIGCTSRTLRERLREFHKHKYGYKSPHRGGQSRHHVRHIPQWIFFAATKRFEEAESKMIAVFEKRTGNIPYANRRH